MNIKEKNIPKWLDVNVWTFDGDNNGAIPDVERIPCDDDDVSLDNLYSYELPKSDVTIKSFVSHHFRTKPSRNYLLNFESGSTVMVEKTNCTNKSGCVCHFNKNLDKELCDHVTKVTTNCLEPIKPVGFCNSICGK